MRDCIPTWRASIFFEPLNIDSNLMLWSRFCLPVLTSPRMAFVSNFVLLHPCEALGHVVLDWRCFIIDSWFHWIDLLILCSKIFITELWHGCSHDHPIHCLICNLHDVSLNSLIRHWHDLLFVCLCTISWRYGVNWFCEWSQIDDKFEYYFSFFLMWLSVKIWEWQTAKHLYQLPVY